MEINKAELHLIYKQIKASPQDWDQTNWAVDYDVLRTTCGVEEVTRCGTTYCFAGHAVARSADWQIDWSSGDGEGHASNAINVETGQHVPINAVAEGLLGLSPIQGFHLFDGVNTLPMIRQRIIDLTGEDPDQ